MSLPGDMSVPPPYTHQPQVQNFSMPPPLHIQPQVAPSYSYYPTVSSYQPTPGFAYQHLPAAPVYSTPLAPHVSALLHTPPPTVVVGVAYNVPPHLSTASYPPPSPMPMSSYTASMSTPSSSLRLDSQQETRKRSIYESKELDLLLPPRRRSPRPRSRSRERFRSYRRSPSRDLPQRRLSRDSSQKRRHREDSHRRDRDRQSRDRNRDRKIRPKIQSRERKKSDPPPHKRKSVPRPVPVPASNSPNLESQPLIPEAQPVLVESEPKPDERVTSPSSSGPSQPLSPARGPTRRPSTPSNSLPERGSSPPRISAAIEANKEMELKRLNMSLSEVIDEELKVWTRSAPADLYYERDMENPRVICATKRLTKLLDRFEEEIVIKVENAKKKIKSDYIPPKLSRNVHRKGCCSKDDDVTDSDSDDEEESAAEQVKNESLEWMDQRAKQSFRLSSDLWDNQPQELNDGPVCRCSQKSRKFGIRHGIFPGEDKDLPSLDPCTNNAGKLYHYRVTISPPTNFLVKNPTVINHDGHEFIFEGFSLFTREPLKQLPVCHVLRFSIKYSILYFEEKYPENVTLRELQLFQKYFFNNLLELVDWDVKECFFFMPRFVRDLSENGKEILSMNEIISYLLKSYTPVIDEMELLEMLKMPQMEWQNTVAEKVKGMLVVNPSMAPSAIRVDQLDREQDNSDTLKFPDIVHFGSRPQQLCYAGSVEYQKTLREYVKYRHLLANMAKPSYKDKRQLEDMEEKLNTMRADHTTKRDIAIAVSCQDFYKTGLMTDIVQHGLLLPVLVHHLRLHAALDHFEDRIGYTFKNRSLLQLAMTHPSYKENFGTNPDHVRNTLTNCGIRQPEYGDKRVHLATTRKRGINMLISIMSRFGKTSETESKVCHNERLEFLGDAVVEFVTSVHLFHMFPDLEEGGLATYRAALVQNQHLAVLAEALGLEQYMLYAHGSDLCHDAEMRHAMANCFEALMGAIYLDSGINEADGVFSKALFGTDQELYDVWVQMEPHPLQAQEPDGDRHWISSYPVLKKLVDFETSVGIEFTHIRLLARAFSDRSLGNSNLTLGSNQRLEFLGDTVLQLVTSDYLYRYFPEHHEGHLSLLRSSMVNNRTQSVVCDDLDIPNYSMYSISTKKGLKIKDRADLLEAFIGALYVDKDLEFCRVFAEVCFFPRLQQFIINQEWNDPKSKLQQCCLTLRTINGQDPDIPVYKVIEAKGPTNTRVYTVAVYFRGDRLAKAEGHSIQQAEMAAAKLALDECGHLFPHLSYQRRIVEKSLKKQTELEKKQSWTNEVLEQRKKLRLDELNDECSRRNAIRIAKRNDEKLRRAADVRKSIDRLDEARKRDGKVDFRRRLEQRFEEERRVKKRKLRERDSERLRDPTNSRRMPKDLSLIYDKTERRQRHHSDRHSSKRQPESLETFGTSQQRDDQNSKSARCTLQKPKTSHQNEILIKTEAVEIKVEPVIEAAPLVVAIKRERDEPLEEGECSSDND